MGYRWQEEAAKLEEKLGIPAGLYQSLLSVENASGDPNAVSKAAFAGSSGGAEGVAQIMPATFAGLKRLGLIPETADIRNPLDNLSAGAVYLKQGLDKFGGDITKAVAFYNTSPKRAASGDWLPETKAYVPKVLAKYHEMSGTKPAAPPTSFQAQSTMNTPVDPVEQWQNQAQNLLMSVMATGANRVATGQALDTELAAMRTANADVVTGILDKGVATQIAEGAAADRAATFEKAQAAIMEGLGLSPMQDDNFRGRQLADLSDINAKRSDLRRQIMEKQTDIFSNPLQWLVNQFTLPQLVNQHNMLVEDQMAKEGELQFRNQVAAGDLTKAAAIAAQKTAKEIAADAQVKLEQSHLDANAARSAAAGQAVGTILQIQNLNRQEVEDESRLLGIYDTAVQRKIQEEERGHRQELFELQKKAMQINIGEDEEKQKEKARVQTILDNNNKFFGRDFTPTSIKLLRPAEQEKFVAGQAMDGVIGQDFPSALDFAMTFANPMKMTDKGQAAFIESLRKEFDTQKGVLTPQDIMGKKEADIQKEVAGRVGKKFALGAKNVDIGVYSSGLNPYKASYQALSEDKRLATNVVNQIVTTAKSTMELRDLKDGAIISAVATKIAKGEIPLQDAAQQVANYYQAAVAQNEGLYKFEIWHLPKQTAYMASVPGLMRSELANLADATVVRHRLAVAIAREQAWQFSLGTAVRDMLSPNPVK